MVNYKKSPFPFGKRALEKHGTCWRRAHRNMLCLLCTGGGLNHHTGANATGAQGKWAHATVWLLVTHSLQVGVKKTLCFNVRMAHAVANLGHFAAVVALAIAVFRIKIALHLHKILQDI